MTGPPPPAVPLVRVLAGHADRLAARRRTDQELSQWERDVRLALDAGWTPAQVAAAAGCAVSVVERAAATEA